MAVKEQHAERSVVNPGTVSPDSGYEVDFFEWTQSTAELIRQGRLAEVDLEHVAEEIESMGRRDRRELRSRFMVLLTHLLKWERHPQKRTGSWRAPINEQRMQIELVIEDSPSLRRLPPDELAAIYERAVNRAAGQTGLGTDSFPSSCPYTVQQILDSDFLP